MTYNDIISRLRRHFHGHKYECLNTYIFRYDWESDWFSMAKSGMAYEVEVKISYSDFKADFRKKHKHQAMDGYRSGWIITRGHERNHHGYGGMGPYCTVDVRPFSESKVPNRFYYCCPTDVIPVDEVPHYAGLLYASDRGIMLVKQAPFLHKGKADYTKILLDKFYYKTIKLERDLYEKNRTSR
jgi:hypothetical protein